MKSIRIIVLLALTLFGNWIVAQETDANIFGHPFSDGLFRYSSFGQSLLADIHPNFVRLDVASVTNHQEWDWGQTGKAMRWNTFGVMGINVPLWSGETEGKNAFLCVSLPLSSAIWLDLGEPVTAPVVNTDYRIALPVFTYVRKLNRNFFRNYSISLAPYKHESTHLGDEITLQRVENKLPLLRVNVSEHYSELVFSINEADREDSYWHTFRVGLMVLWNARRGWYFIDATDGDASLAKPRFSPWEAYLQYQFQSPVRHCFQWVVSAEIRNRALYGYPEFNWSSDGVHYEMQDESRIFTYNLFCGLRFCGNRKGMFSRMSVGMRLYHGNNPYGQFRNHKDFNHLGVCIIFE